MRRYHSACSPPFSAIARITITIVNVIALLVLAILLASFAVNFRDEPLSAEAKSLLAVPAGPYRPDENLYVSMAGFDVLTAQSVVTAGEARIREYNLTLHGGSHISRTQPLISPSPIPNELKFTATDAFCRSPPPSVWAELRNHRPDIAALLSTNQELYQHYLGLHRLRG